MRFAVQSITQVKGENELASHFEVDLVDFQMNSDWQSAITLRVHKSDVSNYYIGQNFLLVRDSRADTNHNIGYKAYHEANHDYALESEEHDNS